MEAAAAVRIRRAEPRDAAALARLAESTFRGAFGDANTRENMDAHCRAAYGEAIQAREIADPGVETLVAESGEELVGYVQLRRGGAPACVVAARAIEILRFYVEASWQGKGLAQRLMSRALESAGESGADVVCLGVWEHNPRALAFYRKYGFTEVGEQEFRLGDDKQRDLVMALRLGAQESS